MPPTGSGSVGVGSGGDEHFFLHPGGGGVGGPDGAMLPLGGGLGVARTWPQIGAPKPLLPGTGAIRSWYESKCSLSLVGSPVPPV